MLLFLELGHRLGKRQLREAGKEARAGLGAVEGAVFGLLGLLIAFTFSGAATRFDQRRNLIVEEANAIGTAYLRLDLLPEPHKTELRDLFRRYLNTRLEAYRKLPDLKAAMATLGEAEKIQGQIWNQALAASRGDLSPSSIVLLPALNAMFDIANTRSMLGRLHPPPLIFFMILILALVCALLAGFHMSSEQERNWLYILGFALVLSLTVYVILDLEYPRVGFLKVDTHDMALTHVLEGMK
jgi:hypothetical protein